MYNYLDRFLRDSGYPDEDREILLLAHRTVTASEGADKWSAMISRYDEDADGCAYASVRETVREVSAVTGIHPYTLDLLAYLTFTRRLMARYTERGIDLSVFWDTVADLRYKLDECHAVKGLCGSFVAWWFPGFFRLERFALGRLQFETDVFGETYTSHGRTLTPDTPVIGVHIPRTGTPFSPDACDEAFHRARAFFARFFPEVADAPFVCHSWLLFPEHEKMLSPSSNILSFKHRFEIVRSGVTTRSADLWRLFDTDEQNPDRLPADSSLRRAYIDYLRAGGQTGDGYGVYFFDR